MTFSGYWYGPKLLVQRVTVTLHAVGRVVRQRDQIRPRLGRRVGRAGLERIGLLGRADLDRAVHLVGADVDDTADLEPAGRVHHDVGAEAVGVDEIVGAHDRPVDMALGREVHHGVVAGHGLLERAGITNVAFDELVARAVVDVFHRRQVPGVRERVVDGDFVVGVVQHVADVVRPDKPGPAGDKELHRGLQATGVRENVRGRPPRPGGTPRSATCPARRPAPSTAPGR